MEFNFSTPVLIRHLWQLKTVVFLHWCLICTVLFSVTTLGIYPREKCTVVEKNFWRYSLGNLYSRNIISNNYHKYWFTHAGTVELLVTIKVFQLLTLMKNCLIPLAFEPIKQYKLFAFYKLFVRQSFIYMAGFEMRFSD